MVDAVYLLTYIGGPVAQARGLSPKVGIHLTMCCIQHVNRVKSCNDSAMTTAL